MQRARKLGCSRGDRTERMRQALLHYRALMERMMADGPMGDVRREQHRREMA
jgi:hypothetical protein